MFTFKLNILGESSFNYPKYTIILKSLNVYYFHDNSMFYYLVSPIKYYTSIPRKFPTFFVIASLYFDKNDKNDKFDLSKLGTDYLINGMCIHFKKECTGSYPDNYIFIDEPRWPNKKDRTARTPLKNSYLWKN